MWPPDSRITALEMTRPEPSMTLAPTYAVTAGPSVPQPAILADIRIGVRPRIREWFRFMRPRLNWIRGLTPIFLTIDGEYDGGQCRGPDDDPQHQAVQERTQADCPQLRARQVRPDEE